MSKAIYMPSGKAGEYAKYACNFYVGCSNDCSYCYCKRGLLGHAMGKPTPTLKKCFKNELDALEIFKKELESNKEELRNHGLFFTFTSDPFLDKTRGLTIAAVDYAITRKVPCKILTKCSGLGIPDSWRYYDTLRRYLAFGFTLTGHDELEPGASTNAERIESMKKLHDMGFKTFASIEPVISLPESSKMIVQTLGFCDLYKIGLLTGKREYCKSDVVQFVLMTSQTIAMYRADADNTCKPHVYWKDSVFDYIGYTRKELDEASVLFKGMLVNADYNIFQADPSPAKKKNK